MHCMIIKSHFVFSKAVTTLASSKNNLKCHGMGGNLVMILACEMDRILFFTVHVKKQADRIMIISEKIRHMSEIFLDEFKAHKQSRMSA